MEHIDAKTCVIIVGIVIVGVVAILAYKKAGSGEDVGLLKQQIVELRSVIEQQNNYIIKHERAFESVFGGNTKSPVNSGESRATKPKIPTPPTNIMPPSDLTKYSKKPKFPPSDLTKHSNPAKSTLNPIEEDEDDLVPPPGDDFDDILAEELGQFSTSPKKSS